MIVRGVEDVGFSEIEGVKEDMRDVEEMKEFEVDDDVEEPAATTLSFSGGNSSKVSLLGLLQFLFPKFSGAQQAHKFVV